ncbi:MAG: 1-acyl-sn-glycerol-3-phosphate acyltransferase [Rhabdochlamydiaceae bacterium]|nr:1-acyl-sn-glycerol-3-phosphate acyltransferase [Rhabdochlamydiaceae bacterium]
MEFLSRLQQSFAQNLLPEKYYKLLKQFYTGYKTALLAHHMKIADYEPVFFSLLEKVEEEIKSPYDFAPYHKQILSPFNYYQLGLDFMRPLIDREGSTVQGEEYLKEITKKIANQENVIFLANHQIEADPQVISILLEDKHPKLAQELIFVAGERVVTDPLAIPFSMGRNLLCIYSKRYIDHPPDLKAQKQLHNKKTMELMSQLLCEGGHAIYVAPSGGRDRKGPEGTIEVAPFDSQSIEMFYLMTQKASRPTSFYPMALFTYDLLPPPEGIQIELGEERRTQRGSVHLAIGPEIPMENIPGLDESDKRKRREMRAHFIWSEVCNKYKQFPI